MDFESLWNLLDELADAGWPADLLADFADEIEALGERRRAAIMRRAEELAGFVREREARLKKERDADLAWWWFAFFLLVMAEEPRPAPTTTADNRRTQHERI